MKNAGKARSYGLYRHLRTSKEIIENLLNYYKKCDKIEISTKDIMWWQHEDREKKKYCR